MGFTLAQAFDPSLCIEDFADAPALDPRAACWADELIGRLPSTSQIIILHAESKPAKCWRTDRFVSVLDHVLDRLPDAWVFDVGQETVPYDAGIHGDRVVPACEMPLSHALAIVSRAHFFVGVDSCFLHAADLFRVPGVALFGPTHPHEFGFRFAPARHVVGAQMDAIETKDVIATIDGLLNETQSFSLASL